MSKFFKAKNKKNHKAGFTLIELLVTISMFVVISGVVLFNSSSFDNSILLHNFTYDVALTIKQAQTYGVNVNENSQGDFKKDYGVYFDITKETGSNTNFVIFNDFLDPALQPNDPKFRTQSVNTCDIGSECIKKYSMNKGTHIQNICASNDLLNLSSFCDINKLSITFSRPSLEANIYTFNGDTVSKNNYAKITLQSGDGATSSVMITSVGQIYVPTIQNNE